MGHLEQLKAALTETLRLTKDPNFRVQYNKEEQEFYQSYVKELNEEINAEYEAQAFIAQREREKEHGAV
jgi:hypothetical protein